MKTRLLILSCLLMALPSLAWGQSLTVFPDAVGHGSDTPAGRGGQVFIVDTLSDDPTAGLTLREALTDYTDPVDQPRSIVFAVGGTIELAWNRPLMITKANTSIYGQTAPGQGITITGSRVNIQAPDVLIQHLHVRPNFSPDPGYELMRHEGDGFHIASGDPSFSTVTTGECLDVSNVVIDHCSVSWSNRNLITIWENGLCPGKFAGDITISNSVLAHPLNKWIHPKGAHGLGINIGPSTNGITMFRNVFAHAVARVPYFHPIVVGEFVNNIVHNPFLAPKPAGPGGIEYKIYGNRFTRPATLDPPT